MADNSDDLDLRRLLRRTAIAAAWVVGVFWAYLVVAGYGGGDLVGVDSHAYWASGHHSGDLYTRRPGEEDAFLYSPVVALLLRLVTWLPWPVFGVLWAVASVAVAVWLWRPWGVWAVPVLLLVSAQDIVLGNIGTFMAAALVLGLCSPGRARSEPGSRSGGRAWHPALLALLPLTKVTTGLPVAWLALRREWRPLAIAVGTVVVASGLSALVVPEWWVDWFHLLGDRTGAGNLWRFALAAALVVAGAVLDRKSLLALALPLSLPFIGSISVLAWVAALPRLHADDVARRTRSTRAQVPDPGTAARVEAASGRGGPPARASWRRSAGSSTRSS